MTSTRSRTDEENQFQETPNNNNNPQDKLDELLLNLRTIAEIKDFDKLSVSNNRLQIDQSTFQFISRWYNSESRDTTLNKISDTLDTTFEYIETMKSSVCENANRDIQRILVGLTTSVKGLEHLKVTYKKDINIITKLDLHLEKINMKINDLNSSINIIPN